MGELEKDRRHEYASHLIEETLNESGITVTANIHSLMEGAIVLATMLLPPFKEVAE